MNECVILFLKLNFIYLYYRIISKDYKMNQNQNVNIDPEDYTNNIRSGIDQKL